jgi:thioredoxin 1
VKVNVDENPELALQYRVDSIPRLIVFKGGRPVAQHSGMANKSYLKALLAR